MMAEEQLPLLAPSPAARRRRKRVGETLSLDAYTPRALARASDHDSSHIAADEAEQSGLVARHEARILQCLRSERGSLTAAEIAERVGLTHVQVARRLAAMRDQGLLKDFKPRGCRKRWVASR